MKTLSVVIGLDFVSGGRRIQELCLCRNCKTIAVRTYINGDCVNQRGIELDRETQCYFQDEAHDVIKAEK